MKRLIAILFAVVLAVGICGCSQYKCRDDVKRFGESAIFYAEQYIDGIITAEEANDNVFIVSKQLSEYLDNNKDSVVDSSMNLCEHSLALSIDTLTLELSSEDLSGGRISDIKDSVEDIKKYISY